MDFLITQIGLPPIDLTNAGYTVLGFVRDCEQCALILFLLALTFLVLFVWFFYKEKGCLHGQRKRCDSIVFCHWYYRDDATLHICPLTCIIRLRKIAGEDVTIVNKLVVSL